MIDNMALSNYIKELRKIYDAIKCDTESIRSAIQRTTGWNDDGFYNLIDRMNPFYHHPEIFKDKKVYLILTGQASKEENIEEINNVIDYFKGLSEWLFQEFEFLDYFQGYNDLNGQNDYDEQIEIIKEKLNS